MDSNLNITIRVNGRQAQQQLRALGQQLNQVQNMVGKKPTTAGATSPWSPAIAKRNATQAAAAAKMAATAQARVTKQAATQSHRMMVTQQKQQQQVLTRAWNNQQQQYRNHLAKMAAAQKSNGTKMTNQAKKNAQAQSKLSKLTPLGFAENLSKSKLVNAGKNINWVGRQLTYNFTLPIVAAGAAAFKFSMSIERQMTNLRKVYGDVGEDQATLKAEVDALGKSFELLSTRFGVHQEDVIEIGAAWAAAGAAGVGLANATRATLETMILGDMDAAAATEGLIAIQAQWRFSTQKNGEQASELTTNLAYLNAIENTTGISTAGLIEVIQRAGGTARTSGASLRELAAMAAALVPATGDAAQAGTALRSIISSLMSPTAQAQEALGLMGITVTDPSWMGAPIREKLEKLAGNFVGLSDAQQGVVSQFIATKWQVSRFDVLMRDVASGTGYYAKALDVTESASEALAIRDRELMAVLDSNPKKWDIMTNATRNALASAFIPMIPVIMSIVKFISQMAVAFTELNPELQKWIIFGLAALAVLGPLMSLLGSTMQLVGVLGSAFKWLTGALFQLAITFAKVFIGIGKILLAFAEVGLRFAGFFIKNVLAPMVKGLGKVALAFLKTAGTAITALARMTWSFVVSMTESLVAMLAAIGPVGWIIVAVVAAIVLALLLILNEDFRNGVWEAIKAVAEAFWQLPKAIGEALLAVVQTIGHFMEAIVEALSYLNPFARHSPSLVDNVRRGVSTILDEYSRLRAIPSMIFAASNALDAFSQATNAEGQNFREAELRKKANTEGASPGARAAANTLVTNILALERALGPLESAINDQEQVVDQWARALKVADREIDAMEKNLKTLETAYDSLGDQISAANDKIGDLAATPIEGMGALEDQIFANQHAQNLLNMELLEFEKQGLTLDSIKDKYAAMAGEIETLQGTQAELRSAGAGSDILSYYDDQIAAIRRQRGEMGDVEKTIQDIEDRLDALDLEGRFLELTKAINFDPLERQIEQMVSGLHEMPFDEIVRQIKEQQAIVRQLTPEYEAMGKQVEAEKDSIEAAKVARDAIADQLDVEQEKLDGLKDAYSDIKNLIGDMEGALNDFTSAVKEAADEASRLEELFAAGEGLDFEDQGGNAPLGREGGLPEIEDFNKQLQDEIEKALGEMGTMDFMGTIQGALDKLKELDFLTPIENAWEKVKNWFSGVGTWIKEHLTAILVGAFWFAGGSAVAILWLQFELIKTWGPKLLGLINDYVIQPIWSAILAGWDKIYETWSWIFETLLQPIIGFGAKVLEFLWPPIQTAWDFIVGKIQWAWDIISAIFQWIWDKIDGFVIPIFTLFSTLAVIAITIVVRILEWLWENASNIFGLIWGVITNVVVPAFEWLWNRASEVVGLLGTAIQWTWDNVISKIFDAVKWALENVVVPAFETAKTVIENIWNGIATSLQWTWDNVISPIWDLFKDAFENVIKPAFIFLRDNIITPIMNAIYNTIAFIWNAIAGVIEGGVNFFIKAFNLVASAVNAVADFLHIDEKYRVTEMGEISMPRLNEQAPVNTGPGVGVTPMAAGGVAPIDRRGGAYNVPRAIVGEGSKIYPEYVIPTDPQYRNRALEFWQMAGSHLMAGGGVVPDNLTGAVMEATKNGYSIPPPDAPKLNNDPGSNYGRGWGVSHVESSNKSWLDVAMDAIASVGGAIVHGAIKAVWMIGKPAAEAAIGLIPNTTFQGAATGILQFFDDWVNQRDTDWNARVPAVTVPEQPGGGSVGTGPTGSGATAAGIPLTFGPGSWHAFVTLLQREGIPYQNLGTYANRPTQSGNPSMHQKDRAMDFGGTQMQLQAIDHALYDAFKPWLHELIWKGPDMRNVYLGKDHNFTASVLNPHSTHVHASMQRGGRFYIPNIPGGVNLNVAEGRSGEQVQILPVDGETGGGTTIVINGNLEFPGVRDGSDAKDFIQNLRALAN